MAPVFHALLRHGSLEPLVLLTGQHREQLDQALKAFDIQPHANLQVMKERQELPELAARIMPKAARQIKRFRPDYVLVHGDTLTTFIMAWVSFLERMPVAHVEAGLRSHRPYEPFPEESNRRLTDALTDLDLAPTPLAKQNLIAEGKAADKIVVTGQTGVDAIYEAVQRGVLPSDLPPGPYVTVTMHRRENWPILAQLAQTLANLARRHPQYTFVYPVHLNPVVRAAVTPVLGHVPNFKLVDPLEYTAMAVLLQRSAMIITDSGGLQEEGVALGVPVAVLRNVTERPEGVDAGGILLAGTDPLEAGRMIDKVLSSPESLARMRNAPNPYGDGRASDRVALAVAWRLGLGQRPADWKPPETCSPQPPISQIRG